MKLPLLLLVAAIFAVPASLVQAVESQLWTTDQQGNVTWDPLLRDFTTAGYMGGSTLPDWPEGVNVTDPLFGAVPDDGLDDTQAFIDAIAACPNYHAVFIPKGRYIITDQIQPSRDHFVLQGEDMYETVLFFPKYISEIDILEVGWNPDFGVRSFVTSDAFIEMNGGVEKSIENLTIAFREQRKGGPWEYLGANAVRYDGGVSNSWVRNVRLRNFDSGIAVNADNTTLLNIYADQFNGRQSIDGDVNGKLDAYSAILPRNSTHNLYHNIEITGHLLQPVDNNEASSNSVFSKISTGEMNNRVVGLHGGSTQYHLYTELNRAVSRHDSDDLHMSWADCTYWNVDAEISEWAWINSSNRSIYVGYGNDWAYKSNSLIHYEPAVYGDIIPQNLYLAQLDYLGKPRPQEISFAAAFEAAGDIIRIAPADDITPGNDPAGLLEVKDAYFKFDLTGANESSVARARLRLTIKSIANAPFELSAWMVTDDNWSEQMLTAANRPVAVSPLDSLSIEDGQDDLVVEFDVTEFARDQLVGGDEVISLYVNVTEGSGFLTNFWSGEVGPKPELVIERTASSVAGAPSAPQGIRSTPLVGNIVLDWDDNPEADVASYNVYRSPYSYGKLPAAGGLVTSDHVDVSSTPDWHVGMMDYRQVYHYWVTAVDDHGYESPRSQEFVAAVVHPSNDTPVFNATVTLDNATARVAYSDNLSTEASDTESDQMYFMKVSGPDWLNVALDGTLSGMPDLSDAGSNEFTFQVTAIGGSTQKVVNIQVDLPTDSPAGAPAAPANFNASVSDSLVDLTWNSNSEADIYGYNLYRSTSSGSLGNLIASVTGTNALSDSTVTNDTTYYYTLKAVDTSDNESTGSQTSATPSDPDPAPVATTGLIATVGDFFVDLQWDTNEAGDLAGYNIYRTGLSGYYYGDPIATNVTGTTWRDNTAENGATYYYVITAIDNAGNESPVSNEDSATPSDIAPEAPTSLFAMARDGEVYLHWNVSTDVDLARYSLYRSTTSGSYGSAIEENITSNSWTDSSLISNGTVYYYTLKAVDASAQLSAVSNEVSATPQSGLQSALFIGEAVSGAADNQISTTQNWDAGLPIGGQGVIAIDAGFDSNTSHNAYNITQLAGTLSREGGFSGLSFGSGSVWLMDGPTAGTNAIRGLTLNNAQFTLNDGNVDLTANNKNTVINGSSASLSMNGGTMLIGADLIVRGDGQLTINGGTISGIDQILCSLTAPGPISFNGGSITADNFQCDIPATITFGGTAVGSLKLLVGLGNGATLDWLTGTKMSMTVASADEWAEAEWNADRLTYNGQNKTALGKTWAQVTATDGLSSGIQFTYDSATETLGLSTATVQNQAPTADAGADQTVTDTDDNGSESVTLDGSGSTDPGGSIVSYEWSEGGSQIATGVNPSVDLAAGSHTITLTVTDDGGATGTDTVDVTVNANSPPTQVVVGYYPFNGSSLASTDSDADSVAGNMVVGAGVTTFNWETRGFWSPTQPSAAFNAGVDFADGVVQDNDYFSFTVTPEAGVSVDLASLTFIDRSGGFSVSVATDQDGFATVLDSVVAAGSWATNTLDLSSLADVSGAIEIRLYFHNGSGDPRMIDNVTINANAALPNVAPTADAGADQTVTDSDDNGIESVSLDGSASNDPDGSIVNYVWSEGGSQIATGINPSVDFAVGSHAITLTVTDDEGATGTDIVLVTVAEAPVTAVVAYYPFNISSSASTDSDINTVAGDMVVGAGVTTFNWETRGFWSPTQPSAAFNAGVDFVDGVILDDDYFSFTITPEAGVSVDLASLSFIDRSGGFSVSVATDQDGFATVVDSLVAAGSWVTNTLDLSSLATTSSAIEVRLYFHDGSGNPRMIDNVEIIANIGSGSGSNVAPTANAGADQTVTDTDDNGSESVSLDGSASTDTDGSIVSYVWSEGGSQIATGINPSVSLAVGSHTITLTVTDNEGATGTSTVDITVEAAHPITHVPSSQIAVDGTVSGSLADVSLSDNTYQSITEVNSSNSSILEHVWIFNVTGDEVVTFYVEAHHTANSEGDDFVFAYSTDDVNYYEMVTVTKTSDDNSAQYFALPSGLSGTVYVSVQDTDTTAGNTQLDTLYIDELVIESESSSVAPSAAAIPLPVDGAQNVATDAQLSWTAGLYTASHDVYFGTNPSPAFQGNQAGASFDPGALLDATTYYWSIAEVNNTGTTAGSVWSFTTEDSLAPDVLHWTFDAGSGTTTTDDSGNARDGTINGASWSTDTPDGSGYALAFANGDFIEDVDAGNYLNGLGAITIAMWVKSDTTNTDNGFFSTNNQNGQDNQFAGRYDKSGWAGGGTDVIKVSVSTTGGVSSLESASNVQSTSWQHITITWSNGGSLKLYIDGVETSYTDAPASVSGTINNVATLVVGKGTKDGGGSKGWSGLIDNVRIYSRALLPTEVQALAQ